MTLNNEQQTADDHLGYTRYLSPVGPLHVVASSEGVLALTLPQEDLKESLNKIERAMGVKIHQGDGGILSQATTQLEEYFAGRRQEFTVPLDWGLASGFYGEVQQALTGIGYGHTRSYGELAQQLGRPGAARAVGTGCAQNQIPVIVPCHRVLPATGGLGGYRGGVEMKKYLLDLERSVLEKSE